MRFAGGIDERSLVGARYGKLVLRRVLAELSPGPLAWAKKRGCLWRNRRRNAPKPSRVPAFSGHADTMNIDLTALDAVLAAGWVPAAQAVLTVIVSTVGLRLALNWTGSAMRRAKVSGLRRNLAVALENAQTAR